MPKINIDNNDFILNQSEEYINEVDETNLLSFEDSFEDAIKEKEVHELSISEKLFSNKIELSWNSFGELNYEIYLNNDFIGSTNENYYNINNLIHDTEYSVSIKYLLNGFNYESEIKVYKTLDIDFNNSSEITEFNVSPDKEDNLYPVILVPGICKDTSIDISWIGANQTLENVKYEIYSNGVLLDTTEFTYYRLSDLTPSSNYEIYVKVVKDEIESEISNLLNLKTCKCIDQYQLLGSEDYEEVEVITYSALNAPILSSTTVTLSSIKLRWINTETREPIIEWDVYRDGLLIGSTDEMYFDIIGLDVAKIYEFSVIGRSEDKESSISNILTIRTLDYEEIRIPSRAPIEEENVPCDHEGSVVIEAGENCIKTNPLYLSCLEIGDTIPEDGYILQYLDGLWVPTPFDENLLGNLTNDLRYYTKTEINEFLSLTTVDLNYLHEQNVPAMEWTINHKLNKFPSVTIIDTSGNLVQGDIVHVNVNLVKLRFNAPFTGVASLN